ncbi:(2Fe-2S)-binding protein [Clostridium magnum]|uniref:Nicotinate dehydrogenase small FeS subunit n=1 Tax=Clostridium magnum DSM 2767 TaxID=1121326 RepID=A0A162T3U4_9CLOT|nr:(2Fe-2S)-binding protein [Clostridium magnum]KZL92209.1 nicotinate dehydrogenase small FeS subunit [Clostridium magnum DSM 2767]SHH17941.1 purine hydroxylase delta subunit apoprotein [Clostridium magnum DSM 2767]
MKISIKVNGKEYVREINPLLRLIDFLRDELKLKGTKEGCGEGECGACTVIMNGRTVNSCLVFAAAANGADIVTIEGVSLNELHPIQQAFIEAGAVQCGYCTPGMVLSAKAMLDNNLEVTEEEIREGISGNLCRCTGYDKIVEAIQLAQRKLS